MYKRNRTHPSPYIDLKLLIIPTKHALVPVASTQLVANLVEIDLYAGML